MLKKCRCLLLPTNQKATGIYLDTKTNKLFHYDINRGKPMLECIMQHFYILSDDKIEEGDFIYNEFNKSIHKCSDDTFANATNYLWKIIATTDTNLTINISRPLGVVQLLPQPSKSFISKYIESYNKGSIITDVMVEYESIMIYDTPDIGKIHNKGTIFILNEKTKDIPHILAPKVSKDNTISIKRIKDTWSRDEVISIIHAVLTSTGKDIKATMTNINTGKPYVVFDGSDLNKWIEDNL